MKTILDIQKLNTRVRFPLSDPAKRATTAIFATYLNKFW